MPHAFGPLMAILLFPISVSAAGNDIGKARLMLSAFACSYYALTSNNDPESKRLFDIGHSAGKEYFELQRVGKLSESDVDMNAPGIVTELSSGPTVDFIIGRIYQWSFDISEKMTYQHAEKNNPTPPSDINNSELIIQIRTQTLAAARDLYRSNNCEHIHDH